MQQQVTMTMPMRDTTVVDPPVAGPDAARAAQDAVRECGWQIRTGRGIMR